MFYRSENSSNLEVVDPAFEDEVEARPRPVGTDICPGYLLQVVSHFDLAQDGKFILSWELVYSLEKVIFVDADQIVRTDMGELYDMDLKGRPLAYTPFCDNIKEMDGYRFWRQGFWKDHLRGRPYDTSALYIVVLKKFREIAAGDNLRVFYETLSKDPNSLPNPD
ncbi:hypothetical protein KIW84_055851 [Lathyrus oleraceus]|uniref:Glucosyltransferase 24 catalytic domain-containing protein n=1 Tax=Pisum sativum TaxID=3888 RepID=A0A9D5AKB1_PEA|nr:hypothetical protein KIW84_055851 [Pisum sativum]